MHILQKVLKSTKQIKLMYGIVKHLLSKPIDSNSLMPKHMIIKSTSEIPSVFQCIDIYIIYQPWSYYDTYEYEEWSSKSDFPYLFWNLFIFTFLH